MNPAIYWRRLGVAMAAGSLIVALLMSALSLVGIEWSRTVILTLLAILIGTTIGVALVIYFIATGRWWLFFLGFVPGYGFAWLAHFLVEKNRPATFKYPLWSFMGDYKMIAWMLTGKMGWFR